MMQSRSHCRNATAHFNRVLMTMLLAAILIGPINSSTAFAPQHAATGLRGPQPFATILCKFADVPAEPDTVAYFERLLGSEYPGLDHYWREVSYDAINLAGSTVTGWHSLPQPQASYLTGTPNAVMPTAQSPVDLQLLTEDCVAAAGDALELSRYVGLNLVFNANLDRPRGTEVCLTQPGGSQCYRTTWFWPDWYHHHSIWAHEMGHAFGLQHSSVGEGNGYGNMWDVMSVDGPCRTETAFGRIGQHPIAYQKDSLGWIPADRVFTVERGGQATITLEQMAQPGPDNYLLARIPIRAGAELVEAPDASRHYYTVEARRRSGYDASLPGDGVIIHEVNLDDDPQVRLVSTARGGRVAAGVTTGLAARWLPGQIFQDTPNGIAVSIDRPTAAGFVVTIYTRSLPAELSARINAVLATEAGAAMLPVVQRAGDPRPIVVVGSSGAYTIWIETQGEAGDGSMSAGASRSDVFFAQQTGDTWGEREQVSDDSRDARSHPALAADLQGNVYAAWVDHRDDDAAIYAAIRPAGGAWGKNTRLARGATDGYSGITLFVDTAGAVHVLWEGLDRCGGSGTVLGGEK
jgi:M6 family metalloprotease-like protein